MSEGFGKEKVELKIDINQDEVDILLKKYKKIKKYMKTPIYDIKVMDGTENYVTKLVEEGTQNQNWLLIPFLVDKNLGKFFGL